MARPGTPSSAAHFSDACIKLSASGRLGMMFSTLCSFPFAALAFAGVVGVQRRRPQLVEESRLRLHSHRVHKLEGGVDGNEES